MKESHSFSPSRQMGYLFHMGAIIVLLLGSAYSLLKAAEANIGPTFLIALAPILLTILLVPILVYRLYALRNSTYILERDGIRIQWGLRSEIIPMPSILWVRSASELRNRLPLPWIYWPGSVVGVRRFGGSGEVEFFSATTHNLVLIATPGKIYAVSPGGRESFLETFRRLAELGTLSPLASRSTYPRLLLNRVWKDRPARLVMIIGFFLSLALLIWVSLVIPSMTQTFLGFQPNGDPRDTVPPVRLLLLPILNGLIYLGDLLLGMVFYRQSDSHPIAFLLWDGAIVTTLIFFLAVFFILQGS